MKQLTHNELKAITEPGHYRAGETLYLFVTKTRAKSWVQRITIHGKRRDIGLGSFKLISLSKARQRALINRVLVAEGGDPLAEKRKAKMPTFREGAIKTYAALKPRWRNDKHAKNWMQIMEKYAIPVIGSEPIDRIGREDVLRILTPLWSKRAETARRLRQKMRAVFRWAQAHGFIENNPAGEMIDGALPKQRAIKEHFRALHYKDVAGALDTIAASGASLPAKLALRFLILTAARTGEILGATWDEVDVETKTWIIPADRMKMTRAHRIPLSDAALDVLEQARILDDTSGLVFPSVSRPGKPMSNMTLTKLLKDNGLADRATVHGFRSSFRDWCADTGKPREIAEAALAHVVKGTEGAYFRSDLFERRRALMSQWADYLTGRRADVVKLHG